MWGTAWLQGGRVLAVLWPAVARGPTGRGLEERILCAAARPAHGHIGAAKRAGRQHYVLSSGRAWEGRWRCLCLLPGGKWRERRTAAEMCIA